MPSTVPPPPLQLYLGVGTLHAVHGVVEHGEVFAGEKGLDGGEVKDGLEQVHVLLSGGHLLIQASGRHFRAMIKRCLLSQRSPGKQAPEIKRCWDVAALEQ